jgi:2-iminobutanoate/2-iminopropanoate deaminase
VHSFLKLSALGAVLMFSACAPPKATLTPFHRGAWENHIGFSQAIRVGNKIYISGSVGDANKNFEEQMRQAYAEIQETLEHYQTGFSNVVMERIYTTDMEALVKCEGVRKEIYAGHLPAATWVEVKGLYQKGLQIEIEVEVEL